MEKEFVTYSEATKSLKLILCNEINKEFELTEFSYRFEDYINDAIIEDIENGSYDSEEEKEEALVQKVFNNFCFNEVKQYYLTDADQYDVNFLTDKYGLEFAYCYELNLWVLLVDFYGVSWDDIKVEVK